MHSVMAKSNTSNDISIQPLDCLSLHDPLLILIPIPGAVSDQLGQLAEMGYTLNTSVHLSTDIYRILPCTFIIIPMGNLEQKVNLTCISLDWMDDLE